MEFLPPVGCADIATKTDLADLERRLDLRFELTEQRLLATFRGEVTAQTRTLLMWTLSAMISVGALVVAAVRL